MHGPHVSSVNHFHPNARTKCRHSMRILKSAIYHYFRCQKAVEHRRALELNVFSRSIYFVLQLAATNNARHSGRASNFIRIPLDLQVAPRRIHASQSARHSANSDRTRSAKGREGYPDRSTEINPSQPHSMRSARAHGYTSHSSRTHSPSDASMTTRMNSARRPSSHAPSSRSHSDRHYTAIAHVRSRRRVRQRRPPLAARPPLDLPQRRRRNGPTAPAGAVRVHDHRGKPIGVALWSPASEISLRMVDRDAERRARRRVVAHAHRRRHRPPPAARHRRDRLPPDPRRRRRLPVARSATATTDGSSSSS